MNYRRTLFQTLAGSMLMAAPAVALDLPSSAVLTATEVELRGSTDVPVGPFLDGRVDMVEANGAISLEAWKIISSDLTTLQIITPLREQLAGDGFEIVLNCAEKQCGGFDFRYEIDLLPEPEMHVDLGDFRYLTARRTIDGLDPEFVSLMVSRSAQNGFIQITRVGATATADIEIAAPPKSDALNEALKPPVAEESLAGLLEIHGRAPLEDLVFQTGSSQLGDGDFASLAELSDFLKSNSDWRVALVGHTDAEGTLNNNIALSKKRANSVLQHLVSVYDVPRSQLEAAGVGYLAPRASNLTEDGRNENRRVEVILRSGPTE